MPTIADFKILNMLAVQMPMHRQTSRNANRSTARLMEPLAFISERSLAHSRRQNCRRLAAVRRGWLQVSRPQGLCSRRLTNVVLGADRDASLRQML